MGDVDWENLERRVTRMEVAHEAMDQKLDRILNLLEVGRLGAAFIKGCVAFGVGVITLWLGYKALK